MRRPDEVTIGRRDDVAHIERGESPHQVASSQHIGRPVQMAHRAVVIRPNADAGTSTEDCDRAIHRLLPQNPEPTRDEKMPRGAGVGSGRTFVPRTSPGSPAESGGACWTASKFTSADS